MFENPSTIWIEILVLFLVGIFLVTLFGIYIYKKTHHLPTGECACCQKRAKRMLKQYRKSQTVKSS